MELLIATSSAIAATTAIFGAIWYFILPRLREQITGKLDIIQSHTGATVDQVRNSHTTNLREDVDRLSEDVLHLKQGHVVIVAGQQRDSEKIDKMQSQISHVQGLLEGFFQSQRMMNDR